VQTREGDEGEEGNLELNSSTEPTQPTRNAMALKNPESKDAVMPLAEFVLDEQKRAETLLPIEEHWRDRYELLLDHGYQLRRRLRPGWEPSWRGTQLHPNHFEDGYKLWVRSLQQSKFKLA